MTLNCSVPNWRYDNNGFRLIWVNMITLYRGGGSQRDKYRSEWNIESIWRHAVYSFGVIFILFVCFTISIKLSLHARLENDQIKIGIPSFGNADDDCVVNPLNCPFVLRNVKMTEHYSRGFDRVIIYITLHSSIISSYVPAQKRIEWSEEFSGLGLHALQLRPYIEGILPKGPYLPCVKHGG